MTKKTEKKIKVLYLARWYPNRFDPMPGLFIQRHAEAAAKYCQVGVVYTHDKNDKPGKLFDAEFSVVNGIPTAKVYYNNPKHNIPFISNLIKACRFLKANFIGIKKISKEMGGFDLVHVHILTRLGVIALFYKIFQNKPYIITEHWSRYLPVTGTYSGFFRKLATKWVVKNAAVVTTVTQNLAIAMQNRGLKNKNYRVLANVVDEQFYLADINKTHKVQKTLIHVSCFEDRSKNITGMLRAISSLSKKRNDFILKLVGDGMDFQAMKDYANKLDISSERLVFTGLLEGKSLVKEMSMADLLLVFSNYENFPVVINESFVLGIPVLATRVGGIPEFVNENNGMLVNSGDETAFEKALNDFLDNKLHFNNSQIQQDSKRAFSPETIGEELKNIYKNVLGSIK
ncbi:MAG TPA: glycosyltransferase [Bacteroidales bacterium]